MVIRGRARDTRGWQQCARAKATRRQRRTLGQRVDDAGALEVAPERLLLARLLRVHGCWRPPAARCRCCALPLLFVSARRSRANNGSGGVFDRAVRICLSAALRDALRSRRLGAALSDALCSLYTRSSAHDRLGLSKIWWTAAGALLKARRPVISG